MWVWGVECTIVYLNRSLHEEGVPLNDDRQRSDDD
eukprot:CAMPEP_0119334430 /NCGR_PEP_ID=MMETSP1333-20130426/87328_1 /TAXON_ID=418940 /ORGANISM="Scyphosphaera apsteinii, Strain RCC1455" /LENGTH=34 /DNA_ID= /DNA_START= /DNA_END= /DNA_ORIENTATION=